MENVALMEKLNSTKQVVNYDLDVKQFKVNIALNYFLQVALRVLHYDVKRTECIGRRRSKHLNQLN